MYDIFAVSSLATAAEKNLIHPSKKSNFKEMAKEATNLYNEDDFVLTPCRFAPGGWKYQLKAKKNEYLFHPNKANRDRVSIAGSQMGGIDPDSNSNYYTTPDKVHKNTTAPCDYITHYKNTFSDR